MSARSLRLAFFDIEGAPVALAAAAVTAAVALLGARKIGTAGLLAPLAVAAIVVLLCHPRLAWAIVLGLVVMFEGPTFGIPVTPDLYKDAFKGLTTLDMLVTLAFASVLLDLIRRRRQPRLPAALALPLALVALATVSGVFVGHANGVGTREVVISAHILVTLLVTPFAVYNLDLDDGAMPRLIGVGVAVAMLKAAIGIVVLLAGLSTELQGGSNITYYEPTANWLIMITLLGISAAWLGGARVPRWMLFGTPLLLASLLLSYRRSFWVATVLALLLVVVLGSTPRRRVTVAAVTALIAGSVLLISALPFQTETPIAQRAQSLAPTKLQTNAEDRYRLDERANVIANIKRSPIAGLGIDVPWSASAAPLGVEHVNGRLYVHFGLLWWWMNLGILGAAAYVTVLLSAALLAWRAWRRNQQPALRAFGLASLCALAGLAVIETTASFTGVDARFTILFGAQLGLLAVLARHRAEPQAGQL